MKRITEMSVVILNAACSALKISILVVKVASPNVREQPTELFTSHGQNQAIVAGHGNGKPTTLQGERLHLPQG